jgi:predicted Holliday junction resolvase-like endonuclease
MSLTALAFLVGLVVGLLACFALLKEGISRRAEAHFERWQDEQVSLRTEASLQRSRAVLRGQMVEHLLPMFDDFTFEHIADARFLGKPVDFIVFDGYTEVKAGTIDHLREIVFIDVKTGKSQLSLVERCLRDCVEAGRVRVVVIDRPRVGPD